MDLTFYFNILDYIFEKFNLDGGTKLVIGIFLVIASFGIIVGFVVLFKALADGEDEGEQLALLILLFSIIGIIIGPLIIALLVGIISYAPLLFILGILSLIILRLRALRS